MHRLRSLAKYILCAIVILILLFGVYLFVSYQNHRIIGSVRIHNGDFQISNVVECKEDYVYGVDKTEEVKCSGGQNRIDIVHIDVSQHCYTYFFAIYGNGITIKPRLDFYSQDGDFSERWNLVFDLYQTDGRWDATVSSPDGYGSSIDFIDIEKNGISMEYWSEGEGVQYNYSIRQ